MLSKSMYQTVLQQTYERYVRWANDDRRLAENWRLHGDFGESQCKFFTERANDFARQATDAMQQLAIMHVESK